MYKKDFVVAQDTGKDYVEFPGGGVDENETPKEALKREAFEEAGVVLEGELKEVKIVRFVWSKSWAKTEKQKARYKKFQGEEMYFFVGKVRNLAEASGDKHESGWSGNKLMKIQHAIDLINSYPFPRELSEYRKIQVNTLKKLLRECQNLY